MKNIDFLPEVYAQKRVERRTQAWWCLTAAAFAILALLFASTQWMIRHAIELELAEIEPKHAQALARQNELAAIRLEIEQEEQIAELYAYLAHPWPRSQLLAGVIRPLPDSVRLTEITIAHELLPSGPPVTVASSPAAPPGAKSAAKTDLALLRSECEGRQTLLTIVGTASTLSELHAYVDRLGRSPPIAAAHLKGVETSPGNLVGQSQFQLHVAVRPGYGQDGGPALVTPRNRTAKAGVTSPPHLTERRAAQLGIRDSDNGGPR